MQLGWLFSMLLTKNTFCDQQNILPNWGSLWAGKCLNQMNFEWQYWLLVSVDYTQVFFQATVNGSKNSILNWVIKLYLYLLFSFLFLKNPWEIFTLLTYSCCSLVKRVNKDSMYLSGQIFFKIPNKTLKLQEKCILR